MVSGDGRIDAPADARNRSNSSEARRQARHCEDHRRSSQSPMGYTPRGGCSLVQRPLYICACCGAECWHAIWEALGLKAGEGRCPKCGTWACFHLRLEFGKKEAAA